MNFSELKEYLSDKAHRVGFMVHMFYQRRTRGWDDRELWNLDGVIAEFILPRLQRYKKVAHGIPSSPLDEIQMTEEQWNILLDKMIWSFAYVAKQWDQDASRTFEEEEIDDERCKEGLQLFAKYFRALWD